MERLRIFYGPDNGGGAEQSGAGNGQGDQRTVAYENFRAVVEAKTGLEGQVKTLQAELQALREKAATVDTLGAQLNEWKAKATDAEGRFTAYTEFSGALGTTDPDVIGVFDQRYRALPEKDRPTRADWVGVLKGQPDQAPTLLRPWLSGGVQAPSQEKPSKPPQPRNPGGGTTPPSAPAALSQEQIRAVREECARTGDWTKWRELSKATGMRK